MESRVRKIDVDKLSPEQADSLSEQIGEKLRKIIDQACTEANRITEIYGMQVKMQFLIEKLDQPNEIKGE